MRITAILLEQALFDGIYLLYLQFRPERWGSFLYPSSYSYIEAPQLQRRSCVHLAAPKDHHEALEEILSRGADVCAKDASDRTALHLAKQNETARFARPIEFDIVGLSFAHVNREESLSKKENVATTNLWL